MAFTTIHTASGLSSRDRERAHRDGPWAVASTHEPVELLRLAGFVDIGAIDRTDAFRTVARGWIDQWDQHRDELIALHGAADFDTRQRERRAQLAAIDEGLLQRTLLVGARPGRLVTPR
jgi:hypothetical protein